MEQFQTVLPWPALPARYDESLFGKPSSGAPVGDNIRLNTDAKCRSKIYNCSCISSDGTAEAVQAEGIVRQKLERQATQADRQLRRVVVSAFFLSVTLPMKTIN